MAANLYSVSIQTWGGPSAQQAPDGKDAAEAEPSSSSAVTSRSPSDTAKDFIEFSVGNPRVDHVTGVVHLYRHGPVPCESPSADLPHRRSLPVGTRLWFLYL